MAAARLLVVDDDPALLHALRAALRLRLPDVLVDTADSAAGALKKVAVSEYDVVVSDIKMPGMDGLKLLAEIRQLCPDTPTLLITGHGQHDLAVQALRGGAFDFIQKPLDREYFVASLSRAIRVRELGRRVEAQQRALEEHAARLERTVEERTRELRDANQAKDEFLAILAHELRNPLASIRSSAELMTVCETDDPTREEAIHTIEKQADHMGHLLDDLLDITRISRKQIHLRLQPLNLVSTVSTALETLTPALRAAGHDLLLDIQDKMLPLQGDQIRLEQVLVNVLHNAIKYTDPGGRIWLTVKRQDEYAIVEIRDTGLGIAPDLLPRVFDPFVQSDRSLERSRGGLGLGLTLVRELVDMHGGSVTAHSEGLGRGSSFTIRLPLQRVAVEEVTPPSSGAGEAVRSRRILLVDDNAVLTRMTSMILTKLGHDVVDTAADGASAIRSACLHEPDVILLDIGLPGIDGYEVARQLRQRPQLDKAMLVAISGYGQEGDRERSRQAGFAYHLVKPVAIEELQRVLDELPARPASASPSHRRARAET
jgi:signal transduction histidine kinase